jgi:hypothetical protein
MKILTFCPLCASGFSIPPRGSATTVQSRFDGCKKRLFAEGLDKIIHRPIGHYLGAQRLIPMGCDENNWHRMGLREQAMLEFHSAHSSQPDIENQAMRFVQLVRIKKIFSSLKRLDPETH